MTVEVADAAEQPLNSLTLYGWSTQDGTPTPDNPIDIVSAADSGEVAVTVADGSGNSQTLILAAANGLPGIPVSSGGNYTDENGQQWVADEIVLNADGTGVYRQNIGAIAFTGDELWSTTYHIYMYVYTTKAIDAYDSGYPCFCNYFVGVSGITSALDERLGKVYVADNRCAIGYDANADADNFASWVAEKYESGDPLKVWYPLATPIETTLTADEIAAFLALKTYSGTTTITNDADAYMDVGYKAKKE